MTHQESRKDDPTEPEENPEAPAGRGSSFLQMFMEVQSSKDAS
nr:hypothetical protein [Rhodococcus sp. (in: high G+C Gram-positive bacteria)]